MESHNRSKRWEEFILVSVVLHALLMGAAVVVVYVIMRAPFTLSSLTAISAFFAVLFIAHLASASITLRRYSKDVQSMHHHEEVAAKLKELLAEQERSGKLLVRRDLELSRANEQLRSLDKMKSEFVSVVTHQLRTPLSAVKWVLTMLLQGEFGNLTPEQRAFLMKAKESNARMITLVNDLARADGIDSRRFKPEFVQTKPYELLQNLLIELQPLALARNVRLLIENDLQSGTHVSMAPDHLRAILQNLLENALRYTRAEGSVTVSFQEEGDMVVIAVADTGIGIPVSEQKMIFTRFYRAPNAVQMETDGSGLGLYIVRNIVESYAGKITFTSKEGEGTTFTVKLPRAT